MENFKEWLKNNLVKEFETSEELENTSTDDISEYISLHEPTLKILYDLISKNIINFYNFKFIKIRDLDLYCIINTDEYLNMRTIINICTELEQKNMYDHYSNKEIIINMIKSIADEHPEVNLQNFYLYIDINPYTKYNIEKYLNNKLFKSIKEEDVYSIFESLSQEYKNIILQNINNISLVLCIDYDDYINHAKARYINYFNYDKLEVATDYFQEQCKEEFFINEDQITNEEFLNKFIIPTNIYN